MNIETENLLSLIYQAGGRVMANNGQLLVSPPAIAHQFSEQIKRLKPEIMLALGHCPTCGKELTESKVIRLTTAGKKTGDGIFIGCSANVEHYERFEFN